MCSVLFSSSWRMMLELDTLAPCRRLTRFTTKAQLSCLTSPGLFRSLDSSVFFTELITGFCIVSEYMSVLPKVTLITHF